MFLGMLSQALGWELGRLRDEPAALALREQLINQETPAGACLGAFQTGWEDPGQLHGGGVLGPTGWTRLSGQEKGVRWRGAVSGSTGTAGSFRAPHPSSIPDKARLK